MSALVDSGIPAVGRVRWGTHFCQFYETARDLADTLVPYFKAGLDGNERCMWVTAPPFRAADAADALRNAVPDLDARVRRGQIEIVDHEAWYRRQDKQGADEVIAGWLQRKEEALSSGYVGFRLTGNTYFLEAQDWDSFAEYENRVNACFCDQRVVALCSYCTLRCDAGGAMDVVQNHDFALARRRGAWTMIESSGVKLAKEELRRANEELERRVEARTRDLSDTLAKTQRIADELRRALADKVVLLQEVHHRVKNNLQIVASLISLKATRNADPVIRQAFEDTLRRIRAMSLVHDAMYRDDDPSGIEFGAYLRSLVVATSESFGQGGRVAVEVVSSADGRGGDGRVDLNTAIPLGLIAVEAITNAWMHAFPGGRPGRVRILFRPPGKGEPGELVVSDDGIGLQEADPPSRRGAGLALARAVAKQVRGRISVAPRAGGGTEFRLDFIG